MGLTLHLNQLSNVNPKYRKLKGLVKFDKYILTQEQFIAKNIQEGTAGRVISDWLFAVFRETGRTMTKFRARCWAAPKGSAEKRILGTILVQLLALRKIISAASRAIRENNVKEAYAFLSKMRNWVYF